MLIPTLISFAIAACLGYLSSAKEKLFLALIFLGAPALGATLHFFGDFNIPFHAPNGTNYGEQIMDLFAQIPDNMRLAFAVFIPAFIFGRIVAGIVKREKENAFTPEKIRSRKKKILKSYNMN